MTCRTKWIMGLRLGILKCRSPIRCSAITALTGFGCLVFELIYNKSSGSRLHNSTGTIFASQKVQITKKADSNMTLNQTRHVQKSSVTCITEPQVFLQSPVKFLHAKTQRNFNLGYLLPKTCLLQSHSKNTMINKKDRRNKSFCNINKNFSF